MPSYYKCGHVHLSEKLSEKNHFPHLRNLRNIALQSNTKLCSWGKCIKKYSYKINRYLWHDWTIIMVTLFIIHIIYYIIINTYFLKNEYFRHDCTTITVTLFTPSFDLELQRWVSQVHWKNHIKTFAILWWTKNNISCDIVSVLLRWKILFIPPRLRRHWGWK